MRSSSPVQSATGDRTGAVRTLLTEVVQGLDQSLLKKSRNTDWRRSTGTQTAGNGTARILRPPCRARPASDVLRVAGRVCLRHPYFDFR
jgi:hypothetical protein